ncbi:hypothetical protein VTN96DRAFT_406 [Rasamsonia emersonii]
MTTTTTTSVLLIGSIPLSSAKEVFLTTSAALPGRLQDLPDSETGFEATTSPGRRTASGGRPGERSTWTEIRLWYDTAALQSYEIFLRLGDKNAIPSQTRFQVCLPSPMACVQWHVKPEFHATLEPLYEQRILEALGVSLAKIPASDLAIQWDLCFEIMALEYERGRISDPLFKPHFLSSSSFFSAKHGILDRINRLCEKIPADVLLGFHFCYGDLGRRHFVEPEDTAVMVDLANSISKRISRPVSWVHMPVPRDKDDVGYFEPLRGLDIGDQAQLYLGLVHAGDEEGTKRRIRTAQAVVSRGFGVATECGLGRMPWDEVESVLRILREVTVPCQKYQ